jgi:glucose-fructose oxidoreductase
MALHEKVGWAIVGCGRVADRRVAPVFADVDDADLIAFCSRDLSKAEAYRGRHGAKRAYDSLDGLLNDDEVQAVYIATPNAMHAEQTQRCLAAGKHVLVDKPMAINGPTAHGMVEAARRHDRLLSVLHQQRFHSANVHLIRLHDEGRLGKLHVLRVQIAMWYPPEAGWRGKPALSGGGVAIDLAPHALDLMMELCGDVTSVSADVRNLQFQSEVEDFCSARLDFASGTVGLMDLSCCARHYGGRIEAFGSEGTFEVDGSMQQADVHCTWFRSGQAPRLMCQDTTQIKCFREAIEDFTDAVLHGGDPAISMTDGLRVMRVIDAIYASARSGRPVEVAAS